jgi:hypothetical protein
MTESPRGQVPGPNCVGVDWQLLASHLSEDPVGAGEQRSPAPPSVDVALWYPDGARRLA